MRINRQDYNDVTVVELQGELDGDIAELFRNTISELTSKQRVGIVIDLSAVGFIASEGLEQLLWAKDYCGEHRCELRLAGLDENCRKIMEITRLEGEFDHYVELSEAVKSFA